MVDAPRPAGPLWRYVLAHAGGVVAYLPLLTLLLPLKVEVLAGDARLGLLTAIAVAGAVVASLSHLLFGWLSDRSVGRGGSRRGWVALGLVCTGLGYGGIAWAQTVPALIAAVMLWQFALNALLAPISAMLADEVPDARKGVAGGLLTLANPLASLASAMLFVWPGSGEAGRLALVLALVALLTLPLLFLRRPEQCPPPRTVAPRVATRSGFAVAWTARLLVQVAGNVLFLYLLFYFESVAPTALPEALAPRVGHVMTLAYALPLPLAVLAGRWSDRLGRRTPFLVGAAMLAALGLVVMAGASGWNSAVAGFVLFACGSATFLGLQAAYVMQMLPRPSRRGLMLGVLNLANTLPALMGAGLAWVLATPSDYGALLLALAGLTLAGGLLMLRGG